ncbi:type II toxin-antitoxin system death-on-curing family toxin [archaeon]|nr:type II toxin-antitoxin system death-on-curing family toxin [archaeon]
MQKRVVYLDKGELIGYNVFILNIIRAKKADKAEVLSNSRIKDILEGCKSLEGDTYDKAVYLLKEIIQKHPFASGNRRTAIVTVKSFLVKNKLYFGVKDSPEQARVLVGVREKFYKDEEIKEWLKDGKIREFRR